MGHQDLLHRSAGLMIMRIVPKGECDCSICPWPMSFLVAPSDW